MMKLTEKRLSEIQMMLDRMTNEERQQILIDNQRIEQLEKEIAKLERFLKELEEARKLGEESNTLRISPIAGIFEKGQLELLKGIMK